MPALLCCFSHAPTSPTDDQHPTRPKFSTEGEQPRVPNGAEVSENGPYKLETVYNEDDTLLPGQLPDTPRDAPGFGKGSGKGSGFLEDTLSTGGHTKTRFSLSSGSAGMQPAVAPASNSGAAGLLTVPPHLHAGEGSFDADFRGGEQVSAPASVSGNGTAPLPRGSSNNGAGSLWEPGPGGAHAAGALDLLLLPEAPMAHAVSRKSGRRRLHKLHRLPHPPDGKTAPAPAPDAGAGEGPGVYAVLARQRLQRELSLAAELPRACPLLLLPYRVYVQPDLVHVVYDGAGEELLSYLRWRQRLQEVTCRGVMRQLLQALAAMHGERWAHRNVSTETVWVVEDHSQSPQQKQQASQAETPNEEAKRPSGTGSAFGVMATTGTTNGQAAVASGDIAASARASEPQPASGPQQLRRERTLKRDPTLRRREQPPRLQVKLGGLTHAVRPPLDPATGQEGPMRDLVGCAYHLAPEAIGGSGYGRPADIWATGVLLVMLLTGRPPFPGANELEVMTRIMLAASGPTEPTQAGSEATSAAHDSSLSGAGGTADGADPPPHPPPSLLLQSPTMQRGLGGFGGYTIRQRADGSNDGSAVTPPPWRDPLQEIVVQAVLESRASAACREVLAGMLVVEPDRRMTALELLKLPWFMGGEE